MNVRISSQILTMKYFDDTVFADANKGSCDHRSMNSTVRFPISANPSLAGTDSLEI
jgi:hypothetical protein